MPALARAERAQLCDADAVEEHRDVRCGVRELARVVRVGAEREAHPARVQLLDQRRAREQLAALAVTGGVELDHDAALGDGVEGGLDLVRGDVEHVGAVHLDGVEVPQDVEQPGAHRGAHVCEVALEQRPSLVPLPGLRLVDVDAVPLMHRADDVVEAGRPELRTVGRLGAGEVVGLDADQQLQAVRVALAQRACLREVGRVLTAGHLDAGERVVVGVGETRRVVGDPERRQPGLGGVGDVVGERAAGVAAALVVVVEVDWDGCGHGFLIAGRCWRPVRLRIPVRVGLTRSGVIALGAPSRASDHLVGELDQLLSLSHGNLEIVAADEDDSVLCSVLEVDEATQPGSCVRAARSDLGHQRFRIVVVGPSRATAQGDTAGCIGCRDAGEHCQRGGDTPKRPLVLTLDQKSDLEELRCRLGPSSCLRETAWLRAPTLSAHDALGASRSRRAGPTSVMASRSSSSTTRGRSRRRRANSCSGTSASPA